MTRWARSGNTQKHQKVPGDATSWKEWKNPESEQGHQNLNASSSQNQKLTGNLSLKGGSLQNQNLTAKEVKRKLKNKSRKLRYKLKMKAQMETNSNIDKSNSQSLTENLKDSETDKNKSEKLKNTMLEENKNITPESKENNKEQESGFVEENSSVSDSTKTDFKDKTQNIKQIEFQKRLMQKRAENGIMLLPPKVEQRIYKIKKSLREKNLPGEYIKEVIRKERRKEELKLRKFKPCLNCRVIGHNFVDCPIPTNQEVGLCFKCGSIDHTSIKCPKQVSGYPFASCFICRKQGHISRDCPQNKRGVYPRGGQCHLCGNVNHLAKDCPSLRKKIYKDDDEKVSAFTMKEGQSVDDEIFPTTQEPPQKKKKAVKIVKF